MRVESTLIFAAAALAAVPAAAAHCPPGEFYRVKLDECVGLSSALARPFLGEAIRKTTLLAKPAQMVPGFVDPPPEVPDPAASKADLRDDSPDQGDNWVWFPMPPVSAALWGHPADPPGVMMRSPEGSDSDPWPALPRQWPP